MRPILTAYRRVAIAQLAAVILASAALTALLGFSVIYRQIWISPPHAYGIIAGPGYLDNNNSGSPGLPIAQAGRARKQAHADQLFNEWARLQQRREVKAVCKTWLYGDPRSPYSREDNRDIRQTCRAWHFSF